MTHSSPQLSPLSRYYLSKLIRNGDAELLPIPDAKSTNYISDVLDHLLSKLNPDSFNRLEQILRLHQEMNNRGAYFRDEIEQLESQIFTLIRQPTDNTQAQALRSRIPIGEMLIRRKLVTQKQLRAALIEQQVSQKRLGEILIKHKLITFDQLDELLQEQHSLSQSSDFNSCCR